MVDPREEEIEPLLLLLVIKVIQVIQNIDADIVTVPDVEYLAADHLPFDVTQFVVVNFEMRRKIVILGHDFLLMVSPGAHGAVDVDEGRVAHNNLSGLDASVGDDSLTLDVVYELLRDERTVRLVIPSIMDEYFARKDMNLY